MTLVSLRLTVAAALVSSAMALSAQQPAGAPPQGPPPGGFHFPEPTNLKVLPKTLTGEQVHEIMDQWEGALGGNCGSCHAQDPTKKRPDGRPMLNFPDDSKPEKEVARKMVQMTEEINKNYISKIDSSGAPVTCGTCHRGHLGPEPFVAPPEHHGPPPTGAPGAPPAAAPPVK